MQEVNLTWKRLLSIWWLLTWRSMVGGFVGGFVVGFVLGFLYSVIAAMFGLPRISEHPEIRTVIGAVTGTIIGFGWGIVVLKMMLKKRYRDFRIALVEA